MDEVQAFRFPSEVNPVIVVLQARMPAVHLGDGEVAKVGDKTIDNKVLEGVGLVDKDEQGDEEVDGNKGKVGNPEVFVEAVVS
eukprot:6426139-Amphidinium_carterae.1